MTTEQILALGTAFAAYLRLFADCFCQQRSRNHLLAYCRGLLSDLPRKSVEPIALAAGIAVRTLQVFLKDSVWDHFRLRDEAQQHLVAGDCLTPCDDLGLGGIIDETSQAKNGDKTPGVQRQWCGSLGKLENCVVTVHLALLNGTFKTLADADLFLPKSWSDDRDRCREAGIPDDVVYRAKWRIALEQLDRAKANGVELNWSTFDEGYGGKPGFLEGLDERNLVWIGEVPKSFRCLTRMPQRITAKGVKGKRADNLARSSPTFHEQHWQGVQLARLTLADQVWQVRAAQVYLVRDGQPTTRTYWLIVARNEATGEVKYFVSNAAADVPLARLMRMAFARWNVEHSIRVSKSEIGFGHSEGRNYVGQLRHMILCVLVMVFVAQHTQRLRGEKSRGHFGASVPGLEPALLGGAGPPTGDDPVAAHRARHCLPPTAQSRGSSLSSDHDCVAGIVAL
jgi:SRSO17 transposase